MSPPARRADVPDAELAVLKVLWDRGAATIREITDQLYPRGETSHYATVQKLLERLAARGCAGRERDGRLHRYFATVERDDLIRDRLRQAADKLCEGSFTPLLTQLVDGSRLAPDEIRALRDLVRKLDEQEG